MRPTRKRSNSGRANVVWAMGVAAGIVAGVVAVYTVATAAGQ